MQLRSARLCLDCDEVHDAQQCPICTSESFAFITRWVPVPDRGDRGSQRPRLPEPSSPETLGAYREMLQPEQHMSGTWRVLGRSAVGLALFGVAGWLWRQNNRPAAESKGPEATDQQPT
jgi:hypothetical protein